MTEFSYWWTTSGTPAGDQVSSYTQAHLARIAAVLAAGSGFEGIAPGYLNGLAGTVAGANTVQINTGGAVVDGKVYDSDAAVNLNIPSASGGGNTRIDRVVLRVNWAAFTVRITRIAGVDAASPTAPAITQTSGTTYDITMYQALVNTSGTVELTDERTWAAAAVDGSSIEVNDDGELAVADGGIATAKLADNAVDDTKAGDRVPQFYRRQGGGAGWNTAGTTTYTPGAVRMQGGVVSLTLGIGTAIDSVTITFPTAFSQAPLILVSVSCSVSLEEFFVGTVASSTTGANVQLTRSNTATSRTANIAWLAIGPE